MPARFSPVTTPWVFWTSTVRQFSPSTNSSGSLVVALNGIVSLKLPGTAEPSGKPFRKKSASSSARASKVSSGLEKLSSRHQQIS